MTYETQDNIYYYTQGENKIVISFTDGAFDWVKINDTKYDREDIKLLKEVFEGIDTAKEVQRKQNDNY